MKKIFFLLIAAIVFTACSDDDNNGSILPQYTMSDFEGCWISYDSNSAIEITFDSQSFSCEGIFYSNPYAAMSEEDHQYGNFAFIGTNNNLRISMVSEVKDDLYVKDYEVLSVDDYTIELRDKDLNVTTTYMKLIASEELEPNETIENTYLNKLKFTPTTYSSINSSVASVDATGRITAIGTGTTFIIAQSETQKVAVKVTVKSLMAIYASYVTKTIDEILNLYGEPTVSGPYDETTSAIKYDKPSWDSSLKQSTIVYDNETRVITQFTIQYNDENAYRSNVAAVKELLPYEASSNMYFDTQDILNSIVHAYLSEKYYGIIFYNTQYIWNHM